MGSVSGCVCQFIRPERAAGPTESQKSVLVISRAFKECQADSLSFKSSH